MPIVMSGQVVSMEFLANTIKANESIRSLDEGIKKLDKDLTEFSEENKRAKQANEDSRFSFTELNSAIQVVQQAVQKLKEVYDFSKMGAMNERLVTSGAEIARQFGGNMDEIVAKVKAASLGTVSEMEIIASANKAMMLGLGADADTLANLMEIAAFRGRAMGLSTAQAFDDITRGIGRNSPLILDNLGIITKGWSDEAEAAGVAFDQQFILNKVLEQGNEMLADAGGLVRDNASEYEILEAQLKNAKAGFQDFMARALVPSIRTYNQNKEAQAQLNDALNEGLITGEQYGQMTNALNRGRVEATVILGQLTRAIGDTDSAMQTWKDGEKFVIEATEQLTAATAEYVPELDKVLKISESINKENQSYVEKQDEIKSKQAELKGEIDKLIKEGWWPLSDKVQDVQKKYDELGAKYDKNAEDHRLAMAKIQYDLLVTKLSVDGLTSAEYAMAQEFGVMTGLFSTGSRDMAMDFDQVAQAVADGRLHVQDFQRALDLLRKQGDINVVINTIMTTKYSQDFQTARMKAEEEKGYAEGGISRGPASGHWEKLHGDEAVIPLQNGAVPVMLGSNNNKNGGGMTLVLQINSPLTILDQEQAQNVLMPYFERGYRELQSRGVAQ